MSLIVDMCMWLIPSHHRTCGAQDRCRYALLTCRGGRGLLVYCICSEPYTSRMPFDCAVEVYCLFGTVYPEGHHCLCLL